MKKLFEEFSKSMGHHEKLIETLETLLISEKILGIDIKINKYSDFWKIDIDSFNGGIFIPHVCSEYHPPYIAMETDILKKNISNLDGFLMEIKQYDIIVQHLKSRNMGYVNFGGNTIKQPPSRIQFLFPKHDEIIEFYNLYKKHES